MNAGGKTFGKASELWYPPAEFIARRGRMNDAHESRFYCASEPHTAVFEVRAKPDDTVTLLLAPPKEKVAKLSVAFVGVTRSEHPDIAGTWNETTMQAGPANYAKFKLVDDLLTDFITEAVLIGAGSGRRSASLSIEIHSADGVTQRRRFIP